MAIPPGTVALSRSTIQAFGSAGELAADRDDGRQMNAPARDRPGGLTVNYACYHRRSWSFSEGKPERGGLPRVIVPDLLEPGGETFFVFAPVCHGDIVAREVQADE